MVREREKCRGCTRIRGACPSGRMGCQPAPFGIAYRVHGAQFNTVTDHEYFTSDPLVVQKVRGMTTNVVELVRLDCEGKLKGKVVPVCE